MRIKSKNKTNKVRIKVTPQQYQGAKSRGFFLVFPTPYHQDACVLVKKRKPPFF